MPADFSYRDYVSDTAFMKGYTAYQKKYARQMRESDKRLVEIIRGLVADELKGGARPTLADIGCSTGNLLLHLKRLIPELELVGGEMVQDVLEECRTNPELAGIRFEEMNVVELDLTRAFDLVTTNAVLYLFGDDEFERAVKGIGRALKPKGRLVAFDFFHPYEQELEIFEKSKTHPDGLRLHFRPVRRVRELLKNAGFDRVSFEPFAIPIDLPRPKELDDMGSYTVGTAGGERLIFRGALAQPWSFLVAQKA